MIFWACKEIDFLFWTGSWPDANDERRLYSNRKAYKGSVFTMKTLIFYWPLEACDTEISISGGSSGDSLHNRTEFSFYVSEKIYVVQDLNICLKHIK